MPNLEQLKNGVFCLFVFYKENYIKTKVLLYFSYIVAVSFIGGGNRRKQTTDLSQVTDKLYHIMLYIPP
jgi:hypothetical protein